MRTLLTFLLVLFGIYSALAQAEQFRRRYAPRSPDNRIVTNYNGVRMLKSEYEYERMYVEQAIADHSQVGSAYFKFDDDEAVYYLGKLLYQSKGLLPKDSTFKEGKFRFFSEPYKVLDVTDQGCRIETNPDNSRSNGTDVFVSGLTGLSGRMYKRYLVARTDGTYEYKTVNGGKRVIPNYKMPKDATKEEYLAYVSKTLRQEMASTNVIRLTIDEPEQISKETLDKEAAAMEKVKQGIPPAVKTNEPAVIK